MRHVKKPPILTLLLQRPTVEKCQLIAAGAVVVSPRKGREERPVVQVGLKKPSLASRTILLVQIRVDLVRNFGKQR